MSLKRIKRPSPALVVATVALFVALGGTAGAVATQVVPLAKRALVADKAKSAVNSDNSKKLGGLTLTQVATVSARAGAELSKDVPGPASTGLNLVSTKTQAAQVGAGTGGAYQVACDAGQKVISGGFVSDNLVVVAVANGPRPTRPGHRLAQPRRCRRRQREPVRHLHEVTGSTTTVAPTSAADGRGYAPGVRVGKTKGRLRAAFVLSVS